MTRWFRFYDEALNDPKILKLSDNLYRIWTQLLCVASKNEGRLPSLEDLCLMVRIKPEKMQAALNTLIKSGLIDDDEAVLSPHNWNGRQYKSDVTDPTAPARQKAYRERIKHRNATVTDTDPRAETEQIQNRTEQIKKKREVAPRVVKQALPLPIGWQPSARAFEIAEQHGQNVQVVESIFRDYLASSGKLYRDYDAAFHNFIRNQHSFNRGGSSNGRAKSPLIQAADDLCEKLSGKLAEFDGPASYAEQLRGFEGENVTRMLPNRRG